MNEHLQPTENRPEIRELESWVRQAEDAFLGAELGDVLGLAARDLANAADALDSRRLGRALYLLGQAVGRLQSVELEPALKTEHAGRLVPGTSAEVADIGENLIDAVDPI